MLFLEGRGLSTRCDYRVRAERLVVGTRVFWIVIFKVLSFFYPAVYGMCDDDSLINDYGKVQVSMLQFIIFLMI
jgi:hypothetical protein